MIEIVSSKMELEALDPESINLYCPTGKSLVYKLLTSGKAPQHLFNARAQEGGGPQQVPAWDDSEWIDDITEIQERCPVLQESTMRQQFKKQGSMQDAQCRVLEEGLALIQQRARLPIRFHPGFSRMVFAL